MRKTIIALICLILSLPAFADQAGERIAKAYYDLKQADDTSATITMVLIDANGGKRNRSLKMFTKNSADLKASFIEFLTPADVAGTRFLTIAKGGESEQRLWLPALKKTRKIAATAKDGDFVGSDLSYYDMESHEFGENTYELLKSGETIADAAFKGMTFNKVQMTPKDNSAPYAKSICYFNDADNFLYRIEAYGKDGALYKTISFPSVQSVSGVLMQSQTLVVNHKKGTKTLLQMSDIKVNSGLKADIFTTQNLEK
jgi:hypothetical protein